MITFSAFADEIAADLDTQMNVCAANGVFCIDVRGIDGKNVSTFTLDEAREYRRRLDGRGFTVPHLGTPIGKIKMSDPFSPHLELLKHCCDLARAFGTRRLRVFSFYPTPGKRITDERAGVMDRIAKMAELAEREDVVLMHENEKGIYGATPAGVADIFATIRSKNLLGVYDPANYVEEGFAPFDAGWLLNGLSEITHAFHVKDKTPGEPACTPAGRGHGQFRELLADLKVRDWSGFMTFEPHLSKAGQYSGFTGPELFGTAVRAMRELCDHARLQYR